MQKTEFRSVNVIHMLKTKVKIHVRAMKKLKSYLDHITTFLSGMSHSLLISALKSD